MFSVVPHCVCYCVLPCHCREELACGTLHVETGDSTAGGGEQPHPERDADSAAIHGRRVPGQRGSPHRQLLCARLERLREIPEVGDDAPVIFTGSASTLSLSFFSLSLSHFLFSPSHSFPLSLPPLCVLHHYFTFILYELKNFTSVLSFSHHHQHPPKFCVSHLSLRPSSDFYSSSVRDTTQVILHTSACTSHEPLFISIQYSCDLT